MGPCFAVGGNNLDDLERIITSWQRRRLDKTHGRTGEGRRTIHLDTINWMSGVACHKSELVRGAGSKRSWEELRERAREGDRRRRNEDRVSKIRIGQTKTRKQSGGGTRYGGGWRKGS